MGLHISAKMYNHPIVANEEQVDFNRANTRPLKPEKVMALKIILKNHEKAIEICEN